MKLRQLLEHDEHAPLVWSLAGKILNRGGRIEAYLRTWDNEHARQNAPDWYVISATTRHAGEGVYKVYYVDDGQSYTHWFELTTHDDVHIKIWQDADGIYRLENRSGDPIVV